MSEQKTASFDVESVVSLAFESLYTEIESHISCFRLSVSDILVIVMCVCIGEDQPLDFRAL
jgi:hypothetical protein